VLFLIVSFFNWFEYDGEIYQVPKLRQCPAPAQHLPILVGGHAEPALRRAAFRGDGWIHGGGDPSELPGMIKRLHELR
jgi:alkanesulfonate monooxygenase SsuD/methylene tetrahydromethanopterin reductase-like flavin-dependent oxidoreductase (luciferase family)